MCALLYFDAIRRFSVRSIDREGINREARRVAISVLEDMKFFLEEPCDSRNSDVYRFLTEQENLDTRCVGFFNSTSKAIMLKAQIDACDSFDEIKKCLLDVITPNQKLPFCKALLRRMGTVRLDVLEPQTPIFQ